MRRRYWGIVAGIFGVTAILNIMAWNSRAFCDWYVDNLFPVWGHTYGRLSDLSSLSIGEMMIAIAAVLIVIAIVLGLVAVFFILSGKKEKCRWIRPYMRIFVAILAIVCLIMTLNCYMLYHSSTFEEKYLEEYMLGENEYSIEELAELRDIIVARANTLSKQVPRDEKGYVVYEGDMAEEAKEAMMALGEDYPQLSGYYTTPKAFTASEFFSQQYMKGYYFPFSLEANYNDVMYLANKPATMCHELAHTKGFIYEDEANMIAFLACIRSDDPVFQYSGYLSILTYINNDFITSIDYNKEIYDRHTKVSSLVKRDNVFLTPDAWEQVEEKAVIKTETVKKASMKFVETNLQANGLEQGMANYSEVVGLLMDYYVCGVDDVISREVYVAELNASH